MTLKGRSFLTLKDYTPEEITYLIDLAAELKEKKILEKLKENNFTDITFNHDLNGIIRVVSGVYN